jgi:hypothetical protein
MKIRDTSKQYFVQFDIEDQMGHNSASTVFLVEQVEGQMNSEHQQPVPLQEIHKYPFGLSRRSFLRAFITLNRRS